MFDSGRSYFLGRSHIRLAPSFVYGRSLWAELTGGKILFTGRQTCSLYLVLWLCAVSRRRVKENKRHPITACLNSIRLIAMNVQQRTTHGRRWVAPVLAETNCKQRLRTFSENIWARHRTFWGNCFWSAGVWMPSAAPVRIGWCEQEENSCLRKINNTSIYTETINLPSILNLRNKMLLTKLTDTINDLTE